MKRIFSFLLLIISYAANGQTIEKVAYYYQGKKLYFPVNNERVVIGLKAGETPVGRRAQLSAILGVQDTAIKLLADTKLVAKFPAGFTAARLNTLIAGLNKQGFVDFVHPCFKSPYGKDMGYGDELVVKLKATTTKTVFDNLLAQFKCTVVKKYAFAGNIYIVSAGQANNFDALAVANRFFEAGFFEYAEPDLTLFDGLFFADPNDPLYNYQWAHKNTGVPAQYNGAPGADMSVQQAWAISTGAGIKVAVIDEGVDTGHADLKANLLQGYDCTTGTANAGDGRPLSAANAHGTNCTGIIAAIANNNIGVAGIAPDSKIIPINLATSGGFFTSEINIAGGFDYAWQHGADVITNSWGGGTPSNILEDAINRAVLMGRGGKGTVVLFASGNNNAGLSFPAVVPNVIAVGGVNMCGLRKSPTSCDGENWWGASYGTGLDVVAPCVKIASTDISGAGGYNTAAGAAGDYFLTFNGTSSATPNAAGVVALILAVNNNLTVSQVRTILEGTCDKLPSYSYNMVPGQPNGTWNGETGHGRVNAFNAVQVAASGIFCNVQIQANGATRFCPGGNVNLAVMNPVAGTNYQWRKEGVNFSAGTAVTASASGSYDVMATAANGCIAISAPVIVTALSNTPTLTANAGVDTFICAGSSVKLGGNPVAANGAPYLADKRAYGMDWFSASFVKFSLNNPLQYDTIAKNAVNQAELSAGQFFTGGDFTPYGYYAITRITNKLIKIDTANGAQQLIGIAAAPSGYDWSGLAWDPAGKNIYGVASGSGSILCIINPFTAAVTQVATVPVSSLVWIAVRNNGDMYAMSTNDYVYRINKLTGAATILPNPVGGNVNYAQDADFDPVTDSLYMASIVSSQNNVSDLRVVNTSTGISSVIGSLGGFSEIDAMGIAGPAYQYNWSPATGLSSSTVAVPVATPLSTTTYTLHVTDVCGNMAASQVTINVSPKPAVAITAPSDSICIGETVRLRATKNNAYTYQWYRNGTLLSGATDSFYVAATGGVYTVKVVNICDSLSLPFTVKTCEIKLNSNLPASGCTNYFSDSGGLDGNYGNNETFTRTVTASAPGDLLKLVLNSFVTESGNDVLTIYDGPTVASPVLATLSGSPVMPLSIKSSSGTLTFKFVSNGSINYSGWTGTLNCIKGKKYRTRASGYFSDINNWEADAGNGYVNATDLPTVGDDSIFVQTGHTIIINVATQLDQIWVKPGGFLMVQAPLTLNNGPGNDLQVDGKLSVSAEFSYTGSITGSGVLTLNGNLDNYFSTNSNVLVRTEITGNTPQTINTGGSFGALYIKNPSVTFQMETSLSVDSLIIDNGTGVTTMNSYHPFLLFTIKKNLNLTSGRVTMVQGVILNLATGYTIDGGNANSFVEGEMQCTAYSAAPSYFFPVGKGVYRPVKLDVSLLANFPVSSTFQVRVLNTPATSRTMPATIDKVSNVRYYRIVNIDDHSAAVVTAAVTLSYGPDDGVTDPASLHIAHEDGAGNWVDLGGSGTGNGTGTIKSTINFSLFYPDFVLANAQGGNNALPVKWLQVNARQINKQVQVTWKTADEINVKDYVVERSGDGISFNDMALVNAGASAAAEKQYEATDRLPLKGNNYYRIKQTDKDGRYSYSKTVQVNVKDAGNFILLPNPATETVTIQNSQPILRLQCFDGNGRLMYDVKPLTIRYRIPVKQWAAGIYQVQVTSAGEVMQARFVKQ